MSTLNWDNVDLKAECPPIKSITFPVMTYGDRRTLTFDPPLTTLTEAKDAVCKCLDHPVDQEWLENYGMCEDIQPYNYDADDAFWNAYLEHVGYPNNPIPTRGKYLFPYIYLFHIRSDGTIVMDCSKDSSKTEVIYALDQLVGGYTESPKDDEVLCITYIDEIPYTETGTSNELILNDNSSQEAAI